MVSMRYPIHHFVPSNVWGNFLVGLVTLGGLLLIRWQGSYLFFHSLVEIFCVVVAFGVFTVFWNARRFLDNGCFLFLGIAYLFVGVLDLLHALAYEGMGVFEGGGANLGTQLWIAARYLESVSILAAPLFLRRRFSPSLVLGGYSVVVALVLGSIFFWKVFPACYVGGLTWFKILSEYAICLILLAALILFHRRRRELDARVYRLLFASILITIGAEVAFTFYQDLTGTLNLIGHLLKLVSFYLIYVAFVEVGMTNPYAILFHELKQSEDSLRQSEARFRGTFENAAVGIGHVALDGRFLLVNEKLCEIGGIARETMLQKRLQDLVDPQDWDDRWLQFDTADRNENASWSVETRYRRPDDSVVWFQLTTTPQYDTSGNPRYAIVVVQDITRRKNAQHQLQTVNETLELRVAERTALAEHRAAQLSTLTSELTLAEQRERRRLAQLLHDHLQQLLVTAKIRVGMVRRRAVQDGDGASLREVEGLLDQTLDASRSLTVELSPPVLYDAGLGPALKWLGKKKHDKYGLNVAVEVAEETEPESEDWRILLFQATRELLFNVAKHASTKTARVELGPADDGELRLTVSDPGSGFDPSILESDGGSSSGFGLFSLQERLHLMGGRLEVDSAPGRGTRVSLFAPRFTGQAAEDADPSPPPAPSIPEDAPQQEAPSARSSPDTDQTIFVLVADDHHLLRESLVSMLQGQPDIEVVGEASDGQAAVEMARRARPDVVVMDVTMPRLDGIQATRQIARALPEIRVVGLSMHERTDMAEAMRRAGAVAYVSKQGPADELLEAIRGAVLEESSPGKR